MKDNPWNLDAQGSVYLLQTQTNTRAEQHQDILCKNGYPGGVIRVGMSEAIVKIGAPHKDPQNYSVCLTLLLNSKDRS